MKPIASVQWYVTRRGAVEGPFSERDLRRMLAVGGVGPEDKVWAEGEPEWCPAGDVFGHRSPTTPLAAFTRLVRRYFLGRAASRPPEP